MSDFWGTLDDCACAAFALVIFAVICISGYFILVPDGIPTPYSLVSQYEEDGYIYEKDGFTYVVVPDTVSDESVQYVSEILRSEGMDIVTIVVPESAYYNVNISDSDLIWRYREEN